MKPNCSGKHLFQKFAGNPLIALGISNFHFRNLKSERTKGLDTWEQFLLETVECQASNYREDLIHPRSYDRHLEEMTESVWQCSTDRSETIGELVRRLCRDHLSPKQQYIVRMIFWDGFTERKIAEWKQFRVRILSHF